jgi:CO dehydrogenase maturation factor
VAVGGAGSRIVVVGKGGVGKSTVTALLARLLAREGVRVVAVDADEQRNLAATLGLDLEQAAAIVPVTEEADYIEEKTGARPGEGAGGMLRLNPDTTDLVDRLSVSAPDGVRLVVMGGVRQAGGGCLCPETALVSAAVAGMHLHYHDVVLMDTHAGVEHFGRALARGFDSVVVVVDPTFNAVQTGLESARMAAELGIASCHLVINRTRSHLDVGRALLYAEQLGGFPFVSITAFPYDEVALACEPAVDRLLMGSPLVDALAPLVRVVLEGTEHPDGPHQHHSHESLRRPVNAGA